MQHVEAKLVREHLNSISLAISTLEHMSPEPRFRHIAERAHEALRTVAKLVTQDEVRQASKRAVSNRTARQ